MNKRTTSYSIPTQGAGFTLSGLTTLWSKAVFLPTPTTYAALLRHPQATARHAYLQIAISGSGLALVQAIIQVVALTASRRVLDYQGILVSLAITPFIPLVGFVIYARTFHLVALLLGGRRDYGKVAFVLAAASAPLTFIVPLLFPILQDTALAPIFLYPIFVYVIIARTAYDFSRPKAVVVVLLWLVLTSLVLFVPPMLVMSSLR